MTVGTFSVPGGHGGALGYVEWGLPWDVGELGDNTFTHDGTDYVLEALTTFGESVSVGSTPLIPLAAINAMTVTVKDKIYRGGWVLDTELSTPFLTRSSDGLSLTDGETGVVVKIETVAPPEGFTVAADDAGVALAWTGPANSSITKWQYRRKAGTGSYGNWTDIPNSNADTRSHAVSGLTNGTAYTFQLRAYTTSGGTASVERPVVAGRLLDTTMTVGTTLSGSLGYLGTPIPAYAAGELGDNTFTHDGTDYRFYTFLTYGGDDDPITFSSIPLIPLEDLNALTMTVKDKTYAGGWYRVNPAVQDFRRDGEGLSLTDGEAVVLKIEAGGGGTPGAPPGAPDAPSVVAGDGTLTAGWTAPDQTGSGDITGYDLDAVVKGEAWNDEPRLTGLTGTAAEIGDLANGTEYALRVRAVNAIGAGAWSEAAHGTPTAPSLTQPFDDLALAHGVARSLDMAEHFTGDGLTYGVMVTTTHKRTGKVKTGPINTVARNKVRGVWSDDVLTLTAGPSGRHVLTLAVTATDGNGATASDSFTLTVDATGMPGRPDALAAVAGDGTVALTWAAPAEDGGEAVASYDVEIGIGGDWSAGPDMVTGLTGTSTTISDLTNGTAYDFRVRAVNGAGAGEWSEAVVSTPKAADAVAAPAAPTGLAGTSADGGVALAWTAPADDGGAVIASYEVDIGIGGDWDEGPQNVTGLTETSATVTGLANGTAHDFRVRAVNSAGAGAWSETVSVIPVAPATLILALPDLELANSEVHAIDMTEHFTGTGLAYEVMVTTTHKRTGKVKTGPINTVARNKVRGAWSDDVLTLTAGPSGHHVLGMEVTATDLAGGTASDEFQLTVGTSETESLATEALRNALASQARSMLEDASSAIGGRMQSGGRGTDALTAFAGLFGGGSDAGACPLDEPLHECIARDTGHRDTPRFGGADDFGVSSFDATGEPAPATPIDLSELRDRVKGRGFAVSLNQPMPGTSSNLDTPETTLPDDAVALTFWVRGAASSGVTDTVFWGLDASMGEQWMAGLAFAESGAEVSQSLSRGDLSVSGFAESDISAVYPYVRSRFDSGTEVWSLMGFGNGQVDSTWTGLSLGLEETVHLDGEVAFDLGLVGAEQRLYEAGGFSLSALGDAGWSRLAVTSGRAEGVEARVSRTRLGVEGRYAAADGALSSSLRAGARVDGGDGATASGMELMGDVRRTWGRWQAGVEGRWYAADTADAGHGSQGVKATLGLQPRANGTGLGLTISPGWGTQSEAVKQDGLLAAFEEGTPGQVSAPAAHLDGRVSWGMRLAGQGLYGPGERLSPYAEFSFVEDGTRHLRTGVALEGPVGMGLALERRESPADSIEHGLMLRLDTRF